ncbi:E3 ubiquitin-protein ligase ZFP91-like isoform X2 [Polyodon spathula]|uniref:E3 ubiquitin-protein ligase ZFP91-like isoform X2 n=1 Tax=Polyodon spathula TaxID=7913 RepID=UPI001B7DC6ED|nr:E3 ubiquitin-protein ligase ZFP91-like isoform X2 [Polyodon spathula]
MEPEPSRAEDTSGGVKTEPPPPPPPPPPHDEQAAAAAAAAAAAGEAAVTPAVVPSPAAPGRVLRDRSAGRSLTAAAAAALSASEVRSPGEPHTQPGSGRVLRERTGRSSGEGKSRASPASGLQPAAIGDGPAAAARRRKAECPRRRRNAGARGEGADDAVDDSGLTVDSQDTKNSIEKGDPTAPKSRPTRSRRGGRVSTPRQRASAENSRATKSRGGPGPLVCKAEPDTEQKEYGGTSGALQSLPAVSEDEEDVVISEEDPPFRDDPKDQNYKPHIERDPPNPKSKPRRRSHKGKEDKEKKSDIKLEADVKEENEFGEEVEPPRKRGRRRKDDKSPRLPKRRKKPPIQYVRCEMEGCGTVLAHPRYLQHHIKYQHLLKKKYVCPHPSCGRLFRLQKQLLRHAKHHTDQRDYICEYCARAFKSSHNLAVHRMIHTGEKPLQCEICGFTCRQKASLNWHMKKHDADASYQFSCSICGKRFEKKDSVVAHKAKSHPEILIAEALAANAGALITSTGATEEEGAGVGPGPEGLLLSCDPLVICAEELGTPNASQLGVERLVMDPQALRSDARILGSSAGLIVDAEALGAAGEVLIEDSGQHLLP